ncbi:T9SS type A sorting domain-containing protein [Algibacter sp. L4_22]|uniref:T9SS type A sorting domain-containing protein n=1 Tax=Algibacter sp. L4_22 TaxID=2942477 RepID=UPI00201B6C21|nr:T9SS type A sorting domain-containing protein [Algibacter sp. L4_22]MCL5128528.1 T9SS type A sorting domain-containing protein [Algibacter sp. L4_22]
MTKLYKTNLHLLLLALFCVQFIQAQQTTVTSLADLLPYLDDNGADIKLAAGTYTITAQDIADGKFSNPLFLFEGSNSTYDFTGVTIKIETDVLTAFGNVDVNQMQILGNENVLRNLTMEDTGDTPPRKRAQSIVIDGRDNRIEGWHLTIRGSYPYGYGDAFGKGGGSVISHRKHSGILVRGLRNHLKDCTIISRSYGHIVFMQAASYPIIEGCYIEGEMRKTDDMLAETSGPAFDKDFMTVWGYTLPAGYMMSLQEAGIRAYNAGTTYIDGVEIERGTDNPTVLNCTVKNARTGVTLAHASGKKYVEGCTVLGSENGYSIGNGTVINCGADAIYGPVFQSTYSSDNGYNADITILPPSGAYYNGHKAVAYVGGSNHDLTFRSDIVDFPSDLKIMVSGELQNLRMINGANPNQNNLTSTDISIRNLTNFPLLLHSDSENIIVRACDTGNITDNGNNNTIATIDCDSDNLALTGAAIQSSTAYGGIGSRAIDGNTNGSFSNNSVTHTDPSDTPTWWLVNLSSEQAIGDIVIFNRTGKQSYIDRLSDFAVYVYDASGTEMFKQTFTNNPPNPSKTIDAGGVLGKTVKIVQLDNTVALSLAEVQVFSTALSINDVINPISLYPNPVLNDLKISLVNTNLNVDKTKITLYNINGQKVLETKSENLNEIKLNLSHLNSGLYLLSISDNNVTITRKIVKL